MSALPDVPLLYSFRRCPYAMRARLALRVSEQSYWLREVRLSDRPAELYGISPKGTVPVLLLPDGEVIEESLEIMRWTLQRKDPGGWLPSDAREVSITEQLLTTLNEEFKPNLDRYKYPNRFPGAVSTEDRARASEFLGTLERQLAENAYLFGNRCGLADMALAPFVRQFAMTDKAWFDRQPWESLRRWLDAFLHSPLFAAIMQKRDFWKPGDPPLLVEPRA